MKERNAKLKYQRELRGWSQAALAREIGTVRQMVCRWEKGETPGKHFQAELCTLFQLTAEELGFLEPIHNTKSYDNVPSLMTKSDITEPLLFLTTAVSQRIIGAVRETEEVQDMERLRRQLLSMVGMAAASSIIPFDSIDDVLLRLSRALKRNTSTLDQTTLLQLEGVVRQKRQSFSHDSGEWQSILQESTGYLQVITQYLEASRPTPALCTIVGEATLLIGDILFNAGNNLLADRYYAESLQAAIEAENDVLRAVVLLRLSLVSIYQNVPKNALQTVEEAKAFALKGGAHDLIHAWAWAIQGEAYAKAKHIQACTTALGKAEMYLTRNREGVLTFALEEGARHVHMSPMKLLGYQGACYVELSKPKDAQAALQKQITELEQQTINPSTHHKSIALVDLGRTYIQQAEIKQACSVAGQALDYLQQTHSKRVFQRVLKFRQSLAPWASTSYARNFDEQIAAIVPFFQGVS